MTFYLLAQMIVQSIATILSVWVAWLYWFHPRYPMTRRVAGLLVGLLGVTIMVRRTIVVIDRAWGLEPAFVETMTVQLMPLAVSLILVFLSSALLRMVLHEESRRIGADRQWLFWLVGATATLAVLCLSPSPSTIAPIVSTDIIDARE